MALRVLQFCVVFTIGLLADPELVVTGSSVKPSLDGGPPAPLNLSIRRPSDVTVGRSGASLRCPIEWMDSRSSPVQYNWLLNDSPLDLSNDTHRWLENDGTLVFGKVPSGGKKTAALEGDYRCVTTNDIGTIVSEPATVRIATLARDFIDKPKDIKVVEGDSVLLPCRVRSQPTAITRWQKDQRSLPLHEPRFIYLSSGSLIIVSVQNNDSGSYSCIATNKFMKKPRSSSSGRLTVSPARTVPSPPQLVQVDVPTTIVRRFGDNATLYCLANSWPKSTLKWEHRINENKSYVGDKNILQINNLTNETAGLYICTAQNNNLQTNNVTWQVQLVPYLTSHPKSQTLPPARTIRLTCDALGWPSPTVSWLKDGKPLHSNDGRVSSKGSTLVIVDTVISDSGLYQCVVTNVAGEVRAVARILMKTSQKRPPPPPPANLTCRPFSLTGICLEWEPPLADATKIQAYSVHHMRTNEGVQNNNVTNKTYSLVESLKSAVDYSFYVRAYVESASENSKTVTCRGETVGSRNLILKPEGDVLHVQWSVLINDVPCGGTSLYKLQWRRYDQPSHMVDTLEGGVHQYTIKDLVPGQKYEVRVLTSEENDGPWTQIDFKTTLNNNTNNPSKPSVEEVTQITVKNNEEILLSPPTWIEAVPTSSHAINITWEHIQFRSGFQFGYYSVCYKLAQSFDTCEEGASFVNSTANGVEVTGLKPNSRYEFKVRMHDAKNHYGNYSRSVECSTQEGVPTSVRELQYKQLNRTTIRIKWMAPGEPNGEVKRYIVQYSPDSNLPHKQWTSTSVRPPKTMLELSNLKLGEQYQARVFAETSAGAGPAADIVLPAVGSDARTSPKPRPNVPVTPDNSGQNHIIVIIIGVTLTATSAAICISYMLWRRRCTKPAPFFGRRPHPAQTTGTRSSNGNSASGVGTVSREPLTLWRNTQNCRTDMECPAVTEDVETHEMQCLVLSNETNILPHIPPAVCAHLDTKGGASYPNGHINGLKYPVISNGRIANGIVRITENPQFESNNCERNGTRIENHNHNSWPNETGHLLSDESEINVESVGSGEQNMSLNSTRTTELDTSFATSTPRRISPSLGPNG